MIEPTEREMHRIIVLSFYCKYAGGEVTLDEDATEYAWITA